MCVEWHTRTRALLCVGLLLLLPLAGQAEPADPLRADANRDGIVDHQDLLILMEEWMRSADPQTQVTPAAPTQTPSPTPTMDLPAEITVNGITLVLVRAGTFDMGNDAPGAPENETPKHRVDLADYYIGKYEVSWGQFRAFVADGGYTKTDAWSPDSYWSYDGWRWLRHTSRQAPLYETVCPRAPTGDCMMQWPFADDLPVMGITQYEAEAFCRWAGLRLPTEAEWEKAASWDPERGEKRRFPWGDDPCAGCANHDSWNFYGFWSVDALGGTGAALDGRSPHGAHNMAGNVAEWVADMYDANFYTIGSGWEPPPPGAVRVNPMNRFSRMQERHHVYRGGSFDFHPNTTARALLTTRRATTQVGDIRVYVGFRAALSAYPSPTPTPSPPPVAGEMVLIPAGPFVRGSDPGSHPDYPDIPSWESPRHWVYLDAYWIGKYEVTVGEYRAFVADGGYTRPAYWSQDGWNWLTNGQNVAANYRPVMIVRETRPPGWDGPWPVPDNYPIAGLSYYEAEAYCAWAGGRLPTEAEWEKAARWHPTLGMSFEFPWGEFWFNDLCNSEDDFIVPDQQAAPIGMYPDDRSPLGVFDMGGNVYEWVADWFDVNYYKKGPGGPVPGDTVWHNPPGPTFQESLFPIGSDNQRNPRRVVRSGAYRTTFGSSYAVRAPHRGEDGGPWWTGNHPDAHGGPELVYGLRLAKDADSALQARDIPTRNMAPSTD